MRSLHLIELSEVHNREDFLQTFSHLSLALRSPEHRIGALSSSMVSGLVNLSSPDPLSRFWLAFDDRKPVASAAITRARSVPGAAYFGFFEVDTSLEHPGKAADMLFHAAETWCRQNNVTTIIGPVCCSTWFPYRVSVEDKWEYSFLWEPNTPSSYGDFFVQNGYCVDHGYKSLAARGMGRFVENSKSRARMFPESGFRVRAITRSSLLERDLADIHRLTNIIYDKEYLFEPIPFEQFQKLYVPLLDRFPWEGLSFMVDDQQGKPVSYLLNFIDQEHLILKTAGTLPEARRGGVVAHLFTLAGTEALRLGCDRVVGALMKDGEASEHLVRKVFEGMEPIWAHNYQIFRRSF